MGDGAQRHIVFICMRCLRSCAPSPRAASRLLLNETCLLCGHSRGYLVYTTDGYLVHKRCGLLLRGSIYHLQGSVFTARTGVSAMQRTFIQFVLPPRKCWGIEDLASRACSVCGSSAGSGVRCSVMGCSQVGLGGAFHRDGAFGLFGPSLLRLLLHPPWRTCPTSLLSSSLSSAPSTVPAVLYPMPPRACSSPRFTRLPSHDSSESRVVCGRYDRSWRAPSPRGRCSCSGRGRQAIPCASRWRNCCGASRIPRGCSDTVASRGSSPVDLLVDRLAVTPWVLSGAGVKVIQEVLALTAAAVTPPPPPLVPAVESVSKEEEEWEASSEDSRGEEVHVSVSERDMLVRAQGRHPVYVNLTRLQRLLQRQGVVLERDPFFQFVGSLPSHRFVTGNEYERAVAAAHNMLKRPAPTPSLPDTPPFPAGDGLWELVDETPSYPTFRLWSAKQGPAEPPRAIPVSRGSIHEEDALFSHEVTKFDGISARRLTLQSLASPLEKLFSRLIAARNALPPLSPRPSRRPPRTRRQILAIPPGDAHATSGAAGRQNRETARAEEFRGRFSPPPMGARPLDPPRHAPPAGPLGPRHHRARARAAAQRHCGSFAGVSPRSDSTPWWRRYGPFPTRSTRSRGAAIACGDRSTKRFSHISARSAAFAPFAPAPPSATSLPR